MTTISVTKLKEYTLYTPETGSFIYVKPTANRIKRGQSLGTPTTTGARRVHIFGARVEVSRLIWFYMTGAWPIGVIDHINGNKNDNRFVNLRDVTQAANNSNKHKPQRNNKLRVLGVNKVGNKYRARSNRKHLGMFLTKQEAHEAYILHRAQQHPVEGIDNYNYCS